MSAPTPASVHDVAMFSLLLRDITGFDNFESDFLAENLVVLRGEKGAVGDINQLLGAYKLLRAETTPGDVALRCHALREDETFVRTIQQILYLFYLGAIHVHGHWKRCGWKQYQGALVWSALGVYAPFTRGDGGFGDWSRRPRNSIGHPKETSVSNEQ